MRFLTAVLSLAVVASASSWFPGSKSTYNKWHQTELERWLSDHDIPYPTPSDRKDLEDTISKNWDAYVTSPYKSWDTEKLTSYLTSKGVETKDTAAANKDALVAQVQKNWYVTEQKTGNTVDGAKDWILDTWSESTLKAFADKHGIPVPQPRKRDTLLQKARSNYETVAKKAGEVGSYPGNWLYESWSESDLKEWLDTHGFPAPQPSSRDKLIASVRRNSHLAYLKAQDTAASATASANAAYATLTDKVIDSWSESQLKEFADKNGIPVPQGTKVNELRALLRKNRSSFTASAASLYGAASTKAGNQYAAATDGVQSAAQEAFGGAVNTWSESRLKSYLDARGVPVPHGSKTDELRALVRKNSHKAASGWNAWTFDDFSVENLRKYLASSGNDAAKKAGEKKDATRDELLSAANSAYTSASTAGGATYASATSYLAKATNAAKSSAFDNWTESELKAYLDGYGIPVPQGSKVEELKAYARKQSTYFKYGTSGPAETAYAKLSENVKGAFKWVLSQVSAGSDVAQAKAHEAESKAKSEL